MCRSFFSRRPISAGYGCQRLPVIRQPRLRLTKKLDNRPTIFRGEMRVFLPRPLVTENLPESAANAVLHLGGEGVKGPGFDQITARVAEQPRVEVEVAEGPALRVAGTASGEIGRPVPPRP